MSHLNCTCNHSSASDKLRELIKEKTPSDIDLQRLSDFFKVISDETRVKILFSLVYGELCVNEIAEQLSMTVSAISHQLRVLKNAELVRYNKKGKNVYYSLSDHHVSEVIANGLEHIQE